MFRKRSHVGSVCLAFAAGALAALIMPLWLIVVVQAIIILYFGWLLFCR